jgi:hypothetical protein
VAAKTLEELKQEILVTPFVDLEPHVARGSVVVVDESLDFLQVALSIAKDDKAFISALILKKMLVKATPTDYESWRRDKRFFKVIILQPFVVVQNSVALKPHNN